MLSSCLAVRSMLRDRQVAVDGAIVEESANEPFRRIVLSLCFVGKAARGLGYHWTRRAISIGT